MIMKIQTVTNLDELVPLYDRYVRGSNVKGRHLLKALINQPKYLSLGVYSDTDELIAFVDGYELTDTTFKLGNIYKGKATTKAVVALFNAFEAEVLRRGYTGWKSTSTVSTAGLVKKLGAKEWEQHYLQQV